jgi:hypothetical protein
VMIASNKQIPAIKADGTSLTLDKIPCKNEGKDKEDAPYGSCANGENQVPVVEHRNESSETAAEACKSDIISVRSAVKRSGVPDDAHSPPAKKKQRKISFDARAVEELCTLLMKQVLEEAVRSAIPGFLESFGDTAPSFRLGSRAMTLHSSLPLAQPYRPVMKRRHAMVNFVVAVKFEFDIDAALVTSFSCKRATNGSLSKARDPPAPGSTTSSNKKEYVSVREHDANDSAKHGPGDPNSFIARSTEEATES